MCFFHVNQLKAKWPENVSKNDNLSSRGKSKCIFKEKFYFFFHDFFLSINCGGYISEKMPGIKLY